MALQTTDVTQQSAKHWGHRLERLTVPLRTRLVEPYPSTTLPFCLAQHILAFHARLEISHQKSKTARRSNITQKALGPTTLSQSSSITSFVKVLMGFCFSHGVFHIAFHVLISGHDYQKALVSANCYIS